MASTNSPCWRRNFRREIVVVSRLTAQPVVRAMVHWSSADEPHLAGDRVAADTDRIRAQHGLGRRDLSELRAGASPGFRQRSGALGIPGRHAVLAVARRHCRPDGSLTARRRRAGLLHPGDCSCFCGAGDNAGDLLLFMGSPAIRRVGRLDCRSRRRGGARACLFRRSQPQRGRRRSSARRRPLHPGAGLSGDLATAPLRRRRLARLGFPVADPAGARACRRGAVERIGAIFASASRRCSPVLAPFWQSPGFSIL